MITPLVLGTTMVTLSRVNSQAVELGLRLANTIIPTFGNGDRRARLVQKELFVEDTNSKHLAIQHSIDGTIILLHA